MTLFTREEIFKQLAQGKSLAQAELSKINLESAKLDQAQFPEAYLRGANLSQASCKETDFTKDILRFARLLDANLTGAKLTSA